MCFFASNRQKTEHLEKTLAVNRLALRPSSATKECALKEAQVFSQNLISVLNAECEPLHKVVLRRKCKAAPRATVSRSRRSHSGGKGALLFTGDPPRAPRAPASPAGASCWRRARRLSARAAGEWHRWASRSGLGPCRWGLLTAQATGRPPRSGSRPLWSLSESSLRSNFSNSCSGSTFPRIN